MTKEIVKRSSRGRTPQGEPNPIDVHVGNRIRLRRTLLGLSQEKLAPPWSDISTGSKI